MDIDKWRRWALAAIPGGVGVAIGVTAVVLGELEYRGLAQNTIPDAVAYPVAALGTILLMVALTAIRKVQIAKGGPEGRIGYWTAMGGLLLTMAGVWPLVFLGPMLIGLGVTIYGATTLAAGVLRSFGAWLHVMSIPTGVISGFAFFSAGFDGGFGIIVFMAMLIAGFMILGFDAASGERTRMDVEVAR